MPFASAARLLTTMLICSSGSACHGRRAAGTDDSAPPSKVTTRSAGSVALASQSVRPAPLPNPLPLQPPPVSPKEQAAFMKQSAQSAWMFVRQNYSPATGLVAAHDTYQYVTMWDIASALASFYSARRLGLVGESEYRSKMNAALKTLGTMPLFGDSAFNKLYDSKNAGMMGRDNHPSRTGYGWSPLDMGRLLVWLKVISTNDPQFAPTIQNIVARLKLNALVNDGYLEGRDTDSTGKAINYQEGRVGYEQYAAAGLAAWGVSASKAGDFKTNGRVVSADGYTLLADARGADLLTSEPFVMMGLELGWNTPEWRDYSRLVYDAQRARYAKTGTLTLLSEDALPDPPAYFYYYLLYRDGKTFVVSTPTGAEAPSSVRWISTKAAFGWHALFPSDYTWMGLQAVRAASSSGHGWGAGVYEASKRPTGVYNLNTAGIVLESALYASRGCAFIAPRCAGRG